MDTNKHTFVIVDYGMGNLRSVANAFIYLGADVVISNDRESIKNADAIIIPGVGAFGKAMANLNKLGIIGLLEKQVMENKIPFLGICLGMQLIAKSSEEGGYNEGFGWLPANVAMIRVNPGTRIPHIGWNDIIIRKREPLFTNIKKDFNFYFVHSFNVECDESYVSAKCIYDTEITAAVQSGNIFATQFHPEKSQLNGLRILKGFMTFVKEYKQKKAYKC